MMKSNTRAISMLHAAYLRGVHHACPHSPNLKLKVGTLVSSATGKLLSTTVKKILFCKSEKKLCLHIQMCDLLEKNCCFAMVLRCAG